MGKVAQCLKASLNFCFNYGWEELATPDIKHLSGKITKCYAKLSCALRYISVLHWYGQTGKYFIGVGCNLIFFNCISAVESKFSFGKAESQIPLSHGGNQIKILPMDIFLVFEISISQLTDIEQTPAIGEVLWRLFYHIITLV